MQLKDIQPSIQQIAVAIGSVLRIDVEIADSELFRIAGTGLAKHEIWKEMRNEDYVYRQCIVTGKPVIIERPGFHELCAPCAHFRNCKEFGEVCCPILSDDKVLGVIGLIAFDEEQRDRLFSDVEAKLDFLSKMAGLIATKLKEAELQAEQLIQERKLSALIGYIDNGIILINHDGDSEFMNPAARALLRQDREGLPSRELLEQLVEPFRSTRRRERTKEPESKLIPVKIGDRFIHLFVTYHPSRPDGIVKDAVLMLADPEHMTDVAIRYTEDNYRGFEGVISNHPLMQSLKDMLRKVAGSRSPVLIRGENGTGKELIAQSIHRSGERKNGPYVSLNCSALPEAPLHALLFGGDGRPGRLAEAEGGTLFLDDIAYMPMRIQVELLRVLENKGVWREGERELQSVDVRIIAATDQDMEERVRGGQFRQQLYYKLSVIPVEVPPLRERKSDILLLAEHFLQLHGHSNRREVRRIGEDAKAILLAYHWPGNISELSNVMEYAVNFTSGRTIGKEHLPDYMRTIETAHDGLQNNDTVLNLRTLERHAIRRALQETAASGQPKEKAAEMLGIGRATLFRKMRQYDMQE
ncbi:sigma 54-interacting transcriptional regulator [Paenibacillus sp. PR3]|uniref:Sigma 54-interacting transcriptional regulator n=1 Tax=Paenibacillus terricola TaxID=2763503 RepID=A0ABR8MTG3_9BACL|nr:sigma 54-interacting transcriptional regulator [Paenibacillus terricola]MBD3919247.1 sigma 54-interacting transcriptional regulator [Paenibacillus terricola]